VSRDSRQSEHVAAIGCELGKGSMPENVRLKVFDFLSAFCLRLRIGTVEGTLVLVLGRIIKALAVPWPPTKAEQDAIAAYLDAETAKLCALVAEVEAATKRLQEYRTSLITAAVTGKIDVRGAVV
jgi:hypothetical protein